jgi:hypothetical protein
MLQCKVSCILLALLGMIECNGSAFAQANPLPANQFMASPSGTTGNLAPRTMTSADLNAGITLGGDLTGTFPSPVVALLAITNAKMAVGAASVNIGTLGGVLGGTLPNPTMSAGAASTNIGALTGDISGSLPSTTVSKIQGTAVGGTTGTGNVAFSVSPSFTGTIGAVNETLSGSLGVTGLSTFNGDMVLSPSAPGIIVNAQTTITQAISGTPDYSFANTENISSFSSATTHFDFVIQSSKGVTGSTTTGSRQAFTAQQLGVGGTANDYFTGGFELAEPCTGITCNSFNLGGNFTGNNPSVIIPTGMTPATASAEEADVTVKSAVSAREGIRIVDVGSTVQGSGFDAAIAVVSSGTGWKNGIYFGDNGGLNFPFNSGSTVISTGAGAVGNGINLGSLTISGNAFVSPGYTLDGTGHESSTGVTSGAAAAAGLVGEVKNSTVQGASGVSLVSGTAKDITALALTAGHWSCYGNVGFSPAAGTTISFLQGGISQTLNTQPSALPWSANLLDTSFATGVGAELPLNTTTLDLAATATLHLVATANFAVSTMAAYGFVECQRTR